MAAIYHQVSDLAGAILTGLGRVASYIWRNIADFFGRTSWLSRRYPSAPPDAISDMIAWTGSAVDAGSQLEQGLDITLPDLPQSYPFSPTTTLYHIRVDLPTITGQVQVPPFYSIIRSSGIMSKDQLDAKAKDAARLASERARGKSPGARALEAVKDFHVSILSVWQE